MTMINRNWRKHTPSWKDKALKKFKLYHDVDAFEAHILNHFQHFLTEIGDWALYPPQQQVSDRILKSVYRGDIADIYILFARQSGKTTTMAWIVSYITYYYPKFYRKLSKFPDSPVTQLLSRFDRGCWSGIFAPGQDRADIGYGFTRSICEKIIKHYGLDMVIDRQDRIEFPDGSTISKYSTSSKNLEGRALHVIYIDECQDVPDDVLLKSINPMGTHTRATSIHSGTPSLQVGECRHFYESVTDGDIPQENLFVHDYLEISKYSKDYKDTAEKQLRKLGANNIRFTGPYLLKWNESSISFTSKSALMRLVAEHPRYLGLMKDSSHQLIDNIYAGIDVAKDPDSTVVTILQVVADGDSYKLKVLNWFEPQLIQECTNYEVQVDMIMDFISRYSIRAIAVDSQSQKGDAFFDMFKGRFNKFWPRTHQYATRKPFLIAHKWSAFNHSDLFGQLHTEWHQGRVSWPNDGSRQAEKFISEMLSLGYEFKSDLLRCHHPDGKHDDYPSSLCICLRAIGLDYFHPERIIEPPRRGIVSMGSSGTEVPGTSYDFFDDEYDLIR